MITVDNTNVLRWRYRLMVTSSLLLLWWFLTFIIPAFLLPSPGAVASELWQSRQLLAYHGLVTFIEIMCSLLIGVLTGGLLAMGMIYFHRLQLWLMPLVLISQTIPIFALAPLLVLWFGYGMSSKIATAVLIIFFPVVSSFFDGLRRVNNDYLDLARILGASSYAQLHHVRLMAALPAFGSGLRMATAVAPIGAIIGEWVGSAEGLGFVMLNANARMQTDMCFAAIFILVLMTLLLWTSINALIRRFVFWTPEYEV